MTTVQALRRIAGNMRLFPTLAVVAFAIGVAEFAETAVLFGFQRAIWASVIETIVFIVILRALAGNQAVFNRLEAITDKAYRYVTTEPYDGRMTEEENTEARLDQEDDAERSEDDPRCGDKSCTGCYPEQEATPESEEEQQG